MALFIADTDVLIDFLRGEGEAERISIELNTGRLCITAITAFELWAGKSPQQAAMVEALMAAVTILPLNVSSARRAGEIHRELGRSGTTMGWRMRSSQELHSIMELFITRNRKHYQRVPGLKLSAQYR